MKAQRYELDLIKYEGYIYRLYPIRGWYLNATWVGRNVAEAFDHREKRMQERRDKKCSLIS